MWAFSITTICAIGKQSTGVKSLVDHKQNMCTCTITPNLNGIVLLVTLNVIRAVGVKVHRIAKSSLKSTAVPNVMKVAVMDRNQGNVVIFHVLEAALDLKRVTVW